jgi:hypothetical protein
MPPIFGLLRYPFKQFIYLKRKFFYFICGRPTLDSDDGFNFGATSAGSHTLNSLNEPHFPFRVPPLTSPLGDRLQPPQIFKRKALLIGVEQGLRGPHKDVRDMRQFLIGKFKFNSTINISNPTFTGRSLALPP